MSDIDKDIEIVKDFIEYIRFDKPAKYGLQQWFLSMENILEKVEASKSDLETWKKIAEKLAEVIDETNVEVKACEEKTECDENCKQCIIDWARKEVENSENN